MKKFYAKSLKEYEKTFKLDEKQIIASMTKLKKTKKLPTSIALERRTIEELKELASFRGGPYQVLMRMFILEGMRKMKKAA